jgi:hypothetical protein
MSPRDPDPSTRLFGGAGGGGGQPGDPEGGIPGGTQGTQGNEMSALETAAMANALMGLGTNIGQAGMLGGLAGGAVGGTLGSAISGALGSALGTALGPVGMILGISSMMGDAATESAEMAAVSARGGGPSLAAQEANRGGGNLGLESSASLPGTPETASVAAMEAGRGSGQFGLDPTLESVNIGPSSTAGKEGLAAAAAAAEAAATAAAQAQAIDDMNSGWGLANANNFGGGSQSGGIAGGEGEGIGAIGPGNY